MAGRLFIIGTPIGNLGDITARALETLRRTTHVFAEDTRRTRALLTHFGIEGRKVLSLHAHSGERMLEVAIEVLEADQDAALVSDAGMPTVSDPGTELVLRARQRGIRVEVIPGPSAVTAAVALSGLVSGPFTFLGFLARKGRPRRDQLSHVAQSPVPTVIFESPKRLQRTLQDLATVCESERRAAICRELTKQFEETLVGTLTELGAQEQEWRGEITLVVAAALSRASEDEEPDLDERIAELLASGLSPRDVTAELMSEMERSGRRARKKDVYARVLLALDGGDPSRDEDDEHETQGESEDGDDPGANRGSA